MSMSTQRVAFFPDSYCEIDGVANTSRQFESFAKRHNLPFMVVHGGTKNSIRQDGPVTRFERRRGPIGFPLDRKHDFDLAFWRHHKAVDAAVREFRPDIVHITGPSDVGQLGALIANRLRVPLAASWHTNLHEYAEQRGKALFPFLPAAAKTSLGTAIRRSSLFAIFHFYKLAQILFAPNPELMELLEKGTRLPCYAMPRGVDTVLFDPGKRDRMDSDFVVGYVGRLTVEKNIHFLADLERALSDAGIHGLRFLIVGQGAEESWLKSRMRRAEFTGVLQGEALARAYANMDIFAFPSRTDTYGNVVLEALASGVPAIVSNSGGPRFIVKPGETGFVTRNLNEFVDSVQMLAAQPARLQNMRAAARTRAMSASWDEVFQAVYAAYEHGSRNRVVGRRIGIRPAPTATGQLG